MVSRCFNQPCSGLFRYLGEGKVFRLEPDGILSGAEPEYFWLCAACAATKTLELLENGQLVVSPKPMVAHNADSDMPLAINRGKGLLLRSLSFSPRASKAVNEVY